jgi:hypothetical protein
MGCWQKAYELLTCGFGIQRKKSGLEVHEAAHVDLSSVGVLAYPIKGTHILHLDIV